MAITIDGSANTIAGLAVGGLPDGVVDTDMLAANAVTSAKSSGVAKVLGGQSKHVSGKQSTSSGNWDSLASSNAQTIQKTGSKMLVIFNTAFGGESTDGNATFRLIRTAGGSDTTIWGTYGFYDDSNNGAGNYQSNLGSMIILDTHGVSASSTVTYSLQGKDHDGPTAIIGGREDDGSFAHGCYITLLELDV